MDLAPYTCRGFPGDIDRLMREVPVAGIDRCQTHAMIRLCEETEPILYGPDFSPRKINYRSGSRPALEAIVRNFDGVALSAMQWVREHVRHPHFSGNIAPDRAMTEEQLIESRIGWCNEQVRVFIALCGVMQIPARLCFLFHANTKTAHTAAEVWLNEKWAMHDVTFGVRVPLPGNRFAEGRELRGQHRELAHQHYKLPLAEYYRGRPTPIDLARGGDLFAEIGICNYLIDGVEAVRG